MRGRGVYIRFRSSEIPTLPELVGWCGPDFVACAHDDIRGGYMIEVASPCIAFYRVDLEVFDVHAVEFFEDSLCAAGGVSVQNGVIVDHEPQTPKWRAAMGFLTHVLDDVDISHPRAIYASTEFRNYVT